MSSMYPCVPSIWGAAWDAPQHRQEKKVIQVEPPPYSLTSGPSDRAAEMDLDHASPAAEACLSARAAALVCSPDMRLESDYQ